MRGGLHARGRRRNRTNDAVDAAFEIAGEAFHRPAALGRGARLGLFLGLFEPANPHRIVLEDLHRCRHGADLVAAADAGDLAVQLAVGQRLHPVAEQAERLADAAADQPGNAAADHRDTENGEAQGPRDRRHLGVEIVEIGAGAEIHVKAGDGDGVTDLADRLFLAGLHIFIVQQDRAVGPDAFHQFMRQLPAIGHHFHAVGADLLGIGRQYRNAVIRGAEQIAGALVVGHGIAAAAEFGDGRFLGHLAGVDFFLQAGGHVEAHIDDRLGLVEARIQHLALHQIASQRAGNAEAEQRHAHQDTELGGNLQIAELHGDLRGNGRRPQLAE